MCGIREGRGGGGNVRRKVKEGKAKKEGAKETARKRWGKGGREEENVEEKV